MGHAEREGFTHIISVNTHLELSPAVYSVLVGQAPVLVSARPAPHHPAALVSATCRRFKSGSRRAGALVPGGEVGDSLLRVRRLAVAGPEHKAFLSIVRLVYWQAHRLRS